MATEREQEILRLIQDDPMISQQELARRVGITRSSVSVHITNLVKKGLLRGRGYLLPPGGEGYVAVVGGANMDIGGRPLAPLVPRDSNPGTVGFSPGGVGRNIAHNLALMGQGVRFVSAFGADDTGHQLADSCRKAGVDITHAPRMEDEASATYLFITNKAGDMELAVADMAIYERITPAFLAQRLEILNRAEYCIFDTNPPQETLAFLCEQVSCPLVVDPVSTSKAKKLFGLLPRLHTLKCNRMEAALLADVPIENDDDLPRAGEALLCAGVQNVVITLGAQGAFCMDANHQTTLPCFAAPVVNTTGAGDAFTAALVHGYLQGLALPGAARYGLAAASLCVASADTISPMVSAQRLAVLATD